MLRFTPFVFGLLFVAACGRRELTLSPPPHQGLVAALYAITGDRGQQLQGGPLDGATVIEAVENPTEILALLYSDSVESLQLGPGPLTSPVGASRGPPEPERVARYDLEAETWQEVGPELITSLRLPPFDYRRCIDAGGCSDGTADRCELPCPPVEAPDLPALPESVCPATWIEQAGLGPGGVRRCLPPYPALIQCPRGEYQPIDSATCVRVGPPCPTAAFGDLSDVVGPIFYVDPTAGIGGDGSAAMPFRDLATAYDAATIVGSVIALSRGEHELRFPLLVDKDIEVRGACAEGTSIVTRGTTFEVIGGAVKVRDLNFAGSIGAYSTVEGSKIVLEGVLLDPGTSSGVVIFGSTIEVEIRRSVISGRNQRAVAIDAGHATIEDVTILDSGDVGLVCSDADLELARTRIVGSRVIPVTLSRGNGLEVNGRCTATGSGLVIESSEGNGVVVNTGKLDFDDLLIRSNGQEGNAEVPIGLLILTGTVALGRVAIIGALGGGVHSIRSNVDIADLVVTDISAAQARDSLGVHIDEGTRGSIERARIERTVYRALYGITDRPFRFADLAVQGVAADPQEQNAVSVALNSTNMTVDRLAVEGGNSIGLSPSPRPGMVLRDVTVRDSKTGLFLDGLGGIRIQRMLLEDNLNRGISVNRVACISLEVRLCLDNALEDVTIRSTRTQQPQPSGIEVTLEAQLSLRSFLLEDNEGTGIRSLGGALDLSRGVIRRNPIGLDVPSGAAFLGKALSGVHFEDNQQDLRLSDI